MEVAGFTAERIQFVNVQLGIRQGEVGYLLSRGGIHKNKSYRSENYIFEKPLKNEYRNMCHTLIFVLN